MENLNEQVGETLRNARVARGLTLRTVRSLSRGRFKPSSLAGYERAERKISLESFLELAALYCVPADRLLQEMLESLDGRTPVRIDLNQLHRVPEAPGRLVAELVHQIKSKRGDFLTDTITLRAGDLEALAMAAKLDVTELMSAIKPALHHTFDQTAHPGRSGLEARHALP